MPAPRVTASAAADVARAVVAVLAGCDLQAVAARAGLAPADLADAVDAYQSAGTAALEKAEETRWLQVRVKPVGQEGTERALSAIIGPRFDDLTANGRAAGWWFMRKPPGWRFRFRCADAHAVSRTLDELTAAGAIKEWSPAVYEPETTAFGGLAGMDIAHDLFCGDSAGVLSYLRLSSPPLGRRELSVLLISAMLAAADLDWFERGDVFARVAALRPPPPTGSTAEERLAAQLRALLSCPVLGESPLFTADGPAGFAAQWQAALTGAGRRFAEAATSGDLGRGLRAVLTHAVIFHWNRLGLPAAAQATLARAAVSACLPRD